jgi:hypothetical protein
MRGRDAAVTFNSFLDAPPAFRLLCSRGPEEGSAQEAETSTLRGLSERALVTVVVTAGAATLVVPLLVGAVSVALPAAALFAAGAVLAEYFQVPGDEDAVDPTEARTISFSSAVHLAAAVGPLGGRRDRGDGEVSADRCAAHPAEGCA